MPIDVSKINSVPEWTLELEDTSALDILKLLKNNPETAYKPKEIADNLPLKNVGMELVTNVVSNLTTLKQQGYVSKTGAYYYIDEQLSEDDQFQQVCDEIETRFDI